MNIKHNLLTAITALGVVPLASATLTTLSLQSVAIYPVFGSATSTGPAATGLFWASYDDVNLQAKIGLALQNNSQLDLSSVFLLNPAANSSSTLSMLDPDWVQGYGIDGSLYKFEDYLGHAGSITADDYLTTAYTGTAGFSADVSLEWTFQYSSLGDALIDFSNLGNLTDNKPDLIVTWGDIAPIEYYANDFNTAMFYNQIGGATSDWGTFDLLGLNVIYLNVENEFNFNPIAAIPEPSTLLFLLTSGLVMGLIGRRRR